MLELKLRVAPSTELRWVGMGPVDARPAMVLLPDSGRTRGDYDRAVARLTDHGGRVFMSERLPEALDEAVEALERFLDDLAEPVVLAGHGFGGVVAAVAASRRNGQVVQLVLVNATVPGDLLAGEVPTTVLWGRDEQPAAHDGHHRPPGAQTFTVAGSHDWLIERPASFGFAVRTALGGPSRIPA